uniref:Uncharacterized protein n=1 Tax=Cyprinus carpio carpio TaxID=630221 RepID=A0A9J7WWS6_CYPCA
MEDTQAFRDGDVSPGCSQFQGDRSNSSEPSCVSMKSDQSMEKPLHFQGRHTSPDLRLSDCGVTDEGCAALASALRSNPSHLRELYLTGNKLGASGVKLLSDLKNDPHYQLQML